MKIFTDQLNFHISKQAENYGILNSLGLSMGGGVNGAKLKLVEKQYANKFNGQTDHLFCIITDKENARIVALKEYTTQNGKHIRNCISATNLSSSTTSTPMIRYLVAHVI